MRPGASRDATTLAQLEEAPCTASRTHAKALQLFPHRDSLGMSRASTHVRQQKRTCAQAHMYMPTDFLPTPLLLFPHATDTVVQTEAGGTVPIGARKALPPEAT
eukprot:743839-Pleurochrysis_carterae.AAC.1